MSRLPDLVRDSRLRTEFRDSMIIHSYLEIDEVGGRFSREEHWKWERFLGRGGFGQVRLQKCVAKGAKQDSLRAVKIINKPLNPSESLNCNRELEAIIKFSNDRYKRWFVKSFGWFEDPTSIFITMEYCRHGDLHHYLQRERSVPAGEVQQLAYQILEGLDQMHQNGFAHRDLKPGNILIKSMPPEEKWWIVLADFGISKREDESNGPTTAIKGTAAFMAPELLGYLDQDRPNSIADFKAADMWALGEIIFQMLTGETTFESPVEVMKYCNAQRQFPSNRLPISATDDGHKFVTSLMTALPQDRMTTSQGIQHRWMESLRMEEELAALNLEQSIPLVPEISWNESASARWSRLSNADQESFILAELALVQTLEGHSHMIRAVAFSPDGRRLASGSGDRTVRLWDARSGRLVRTLEGDLSTGWAIAFSPDSKRLAFPSRDHVVRLWNARSGKLVQTLEGHSSSVLVVAFSPDGKRLASASRDSTARLWDARSGKLVQTLNGYFNSEWAIAFSPDSKRLAFPSSDGTVRLWDVRSGELVRIFEGHTDSVRAVAFSSDGKLASASSDGTVRLWDAGSGEPVQTLKSHLRRAIAVAVAFSPDGKRLAFVSGGDMVRLWDVRSGELVRILEGHSGWVKDVAFSSDGKLASASSDGTVRLWDAGSGEPIQTLKSHLRRALAVAFSPDGKWLASGWQDGTIQLWGAGVKKD